MGPVVVKFIDKYDPKKIATTKQDKKVLRSGKPISLLELKRKREVNEKQQLKQAKTKEDGEDIKNDLNLQRLLDESHILANDNNSSSNNNNKLKFSGAELTLKTLNIDQPIGKSRVRTLDFRIKNLSELNGNSKVNKLEKIPMNMRKGMIKSTIDKIDKYEKYAKESGIILSKTKKGELRNINDNAFVSINDRIGNGMKKKNKLRDRGLKIHSIGKSTQNGLVISETEIAKLSSKRNNNRKKRR